MYTLSDIKKLNKEAGGLFFEKNYRKFWGTTKEEVHQNRDKVVYVYNRRFSQDSEIVWKMTFFNTTTHRMTTLLETFDSYDKVIRATQQYIGGE